MNGFFTISGHAAPNYLYFISYIIVFSFISLENLLSSLYALYIIFLVIVSNFAFTIAVYFVY